MKRIVVFVLAAFFTGLAGAAGAAKLPNELHLTNGAVLKNVSAVTWEKDRVVIKHAGGTVGIFFRHIAEPDCTAALAAREAALERGPAAAPAPAGEKTKTFAGQVFIATRGGTNVKLGGVKVRVFGLESLSQFETNANTIALPKPIATVLTDADGKFSVSVPAERTVFIFAQGQRLVGRDQEIYTWTVAEKQIESPGNVLLTNSNLGRNLAVTVSDN